MVVWKAAHWDDYLVVKKAVSMVAGTVVVLAVKVVVLSVDLLGQTRVVTKVQTKAESMVLQLEFRKALSKAAM